MMVVRWKHRYLRRRQELAHSAMLVRGGWRHGTVRQRVVRYLGAIRERARPAPTPCARCWAGVAPRLAALALAPATCQAVEAQLAAVVPRVLAVPDSTPGAHDRPGLPQTAMDTRPSPPAAGLGSIARVAEPAGAAGAWWACRTRGRARPPGGRWGAPRPLLAGVRPPTRARRKERMHRGTALRHTVRRGGLTTVTLGGLLLVARLPWLRLHLSSSLPWGVYRLHPVPDTLTRGPLAVVPVPALMQPWYPAWAPLLKPVAGVAGDVLTMQDGRFSLNGTDYGPVQRRAGGRPLPHVSSPRRLEAGAVCLASPAPRRLGGRNT